MSIQKLGLKLYFYSFLGKYAAFWAKFLIFCLEIWLQVTQMEVPTSPKAVLERLKQGTGSKTDKDLAEKLGVAQQSVYNVNAKDKVPEGWVRKLALQYNLSTDWLYFGEGTMYRTGADASSPGSNAAIDRRVLLDVVETLEEILDSAKKSLPPKAKAELIYQLYQLVLEEEADNRKPLRIFKLVQGALFVNE